MRHAVPVPCSSFPYASIADTLDLPGAFGLLGFPACLQRGAHLHNRTTCGFRPRILGRVKVVGTWLVWCSSGGFGLRVSLDGAFGR